MLRDITERVVIASKGRFDRARPVKDRAAEGRPHESTLMADDFMALTLDIWSMPTESARRVGHPAPFPVELPEQLIRLYTFKDDLVLDPFMGSGSTLVAAAMLDRRYIGYDLDASYVDIARRRVGDALAVRGVAGDDPFHAVRRDGSAAPKLAEDALTAAGFTITHAKHRVPKTGVTVSFEATDANRGPWLFDVPGSFTSHRDGLVRTDVVWRALGRAHAIRGRSPLPLVLLTTNLPKPRERGRHRTSFGRARRVLRCDRPAVG